jgi:hypothetical protein
MSAATPTATDDQLQKYAGLIAKIVHIPIQQAMDLAVERDWLPAHADSKCHRKIDG